MRVKNIFLTILAMFMPVLLSCMIALNVNAARDGYDETQDTPKEKEYVWKIEPGEISYVNASGQTVNINGIYKRDCSGIFTICLGGTYEYPGANDAGLEFKMGKCKIGTQSTASGNASWDKEADCLVPYLNGKRLTDAGKGVPGTESLGTGASASDIKNAIVKYMKDVKLSNVKQVCVGGKCEEAKGEKKPDDATAGTGKDSEADDDADSSPNCYDGGGALGWVLCPIVIQFSDWMTHLYNGFVEPALQVESSLIFGDSGQKGTYQAWVAFRNIANSIFIILFLFVIFSQLTGVGIDNYGIKKALPKLIVMAVMINLSFIVCALAVDVSNILGFSLKEMLFGLSDSITVTNKELVEASSNSLSAGGKTLSWGILIAGIIITSSAFAAVWANPAIVITAFISILASFISLMFLFVILATRKALIILLIAISPVAISLYALPNTKSLFDKWFGIFKAMLLVFPTVGLLMGAGQLASAIILAANDGQEFFLWLIGMIVSLAPIFLVPSVIKSSLGALGTVGAKLAGMGSIISSGAKKRMTESKSNQAMQASGARRQARIRAGMNRDGSVNTKSLRGRFARSRLGKMTGANETMTSARADYKKMVKDEGARKMLMDDEMYDSDVGNIRYDAEKAMYDQRVGDMINGTEIQSFLDQAIEDGDGIAIASAAEKLEAIGELDKFTESIMGGTVRKDKDGNVMKDANGNAIMRKGITAQALQNETFKARVGNTMIGLKKSSPHLGAYGAYLKNGGSGTIVDAAAGRNLNGAKSIGGYMQGFGDSILSDADKTSLEAMGTLAQAAGVSASSFVNDSQVATGISGLSSDKARDKFVGAGFISSQNQASVAGRLTTGRGINDAIASQIGYDNLRANTTLVTEARSQNVSGLDATYRTNILNGTGPRPT